MTRLSMSNASSTWQTPCDTVGSRSSSINTSTPLPTRAGGALDGDALDEANFVLMVCTKTYQRRVLEQEQPGKGLGVRWEGRAYASQ